MAENLEVVGTIRAGIGACYLASYLHPEGEDEAVEAFTSSRKAEHWIADRAADDGLGPVLWRSEMIGGNPPYQARVAYVSC